MDLQRIEEIVRNYGVPSSEADIVRIIQDRDGVDVSSLFENSSDVFDRAAFTTEDSELIYRAYLDYRHRNRISSPDFFSSHDRHSISVGRSSSPKGNIRDCINVVSRYLKNHLILLGINSIPAPIVYDQNVKYDLDPFLPAAPDHIRIQMMIQPYVYDYYAIRREPVTFRSEFRERRITFAGPLVRRDRGWAQPVNINEMIAQGWEIIYIQNDSGDPIPIGAKLNRESDPNGRHLIIFYSSSKGSDGSANSFFIAAGIAAIADRWVVNESNSPITQEQREAVENLRRILPIASGVTFRIGVLDASIETQRNTAEQHHTLAAQALRTIEENSVELAALRRDLPGRVVEQLRQMYSVVDSIIGMRPVASAEIVESGNSPVLRVVTKAYGMQKAGRSPVLIPPIEYKVDMMNSHFQRGTEASNADPSRFRERVIHPHISGNTICWGEAGRPLAEAWARKDWASYMRLIFGWHTQYNGRSPYNNWTVLTARLHRAPRRGWLEPDEVEAILTNETNETVDLVGEEQSAAEPIPF